MLNSAMAFLRRFFLFFLVFGAPLLAGLAHADENFVSGTYQDSTGNQYLVTGAAPSLTGRAQWTVTSTVAKAGTNNFFNAIWETGAAVGNTYLAGSSSVASNPTGYPAGISYGLASDNNWGWSSGATLSVSQLGSNLVISLLNANGSVSGTPRTLSFVSAGGATSSSSTSFQTGIYKDSVGNRYVVNGAAPSQTGVAQWTLTSTTPAGTLSNTFNAIWETGAAAGNTYLAGSTNVTNNPAGYSAGRSYGLASDNNWGWSTGAVLSVSQVGGTLVVSSLASNGTTSTSRTLSYVSAGGSSSTSSTTFQTGVYKDASGNQYVVNGSAPSRSGGVAQWTVTSTTPGGTLANTFNAIWETGAASSNTYLAGNSNVTNSPAGYASGRAYGLASDNNWGWSQGAVLSVSQVGGTLVVSLLSNSGSTNSSRTLSYVSAGGSSSTSSTSFQAGVYKDASGNQYMVSGGAPSQTGGIAQWTVVSTTPGGTLSNTFNAIWETGPAIGNSYLAGSSNVTASPAGYSNGRAYGLARDNNWGWSVGAVLSVSQVGGSLVVSDLLSSGATNASRVLSFVSSNATAATTDAATLYRPGTYQDSIGNRYQVTGTLPVMAAEGPMALPAPTPGGGPAVR